MWDSGRTSPGGTSPQRRRVPPSKRPALGAIIRLACLLGVLGYGAVLLWGKLESNAPVISPYTKAPADGSQADGEPSVSPTCPPALIDWSAYADPGPMFQGKAAIYTRDWSDASIIWIIHSLQGLGYQARLYALEGDEDGVNQFLDNLATVGLGATASVQVGHREHTHTHTNIRATHTGRCQGQRFQHTAMQTRSCIVQHAASQARAQ